MKHAAGYAFGTGVFTTATLFAAAQWGIRSQKTYEIIHADPTLTAILAGMIPFTWAFAMILSRPDFQYLDGRPSILFVLTVPVATVTSLVVMSAWPLILGDSAPGDVVASTLVTDPGSLLLVAFYMCASFAWFTAIVVALSGDVSMKAGMTVGLVLVAGVFIGFFGGIQIFTNPPGAVAFVVWWALAVLGLITLTVLVVRQSRLEVEAG